jgi:hypothetical protein
MILSYSLSGIGPGTLVSIMRLSDECYKYDSNIKIP